MNDVKGKGWLIFVIGLLLIVGIGGKAYMDKREERKEAEKIETERMSVVALKQRYKDIKSVEIKESSFDKKTGAFDVSVKMTSEKNESVDFTYTYWIGEKSLGLDLMVDKNVQVRGITTSKVQVIYSNKEGGEV